MVLSCCRMSSLAAMLAVIAVGCNNQPSDVPHTYSVTGTVKYKSGEPVAGGAISFASDADRSLSVSGEIKDDGSFTLHTVKGRDRVAGAPEGEYSVTVMPPLPADHQPVAVMELAKKYRVEPHENTFTIEVAPVKKKDVDRGKVFEKR